MYAANMYDTRRALLETSMFQRLSDIHLRAMKSNFLDPAEYIGRDRKREMKSKFV